MDSRNRQILSSLLVVVVLLLAASLACGTTTITGSLNVATQVALTLAAGNANPASATISPSGSSVDFNGITFSYDPSIAQGVTTSVIPAVPAGEGAPFDMAPQTEQIDFTSYVTGDKFHDPRIMVYPVNEYKALNPQVADIITKLQQYIANKPNIPSGSIPFLPIWNAGQLFSAAPAFISFQNGQGIRFLAEYGQYMAPVNNTDLFYTFQGITNDGNYYVSAILPITHPSLPANYQVDATLQAQIDANYDAYLAGILPTLAAQPPDSFTPNLSFLDAMIISLKIH
ncbi:MAG: hypothetical protein WBV22_12775 [Anaerolineaceae bacterium]